MVEPTILRRLSIRARDSDRILTCLSKSSSIMCLLEGHAFVIVLRNGLLYFEGVTIHSAYHLPDGGFICCNAPGTNLALWINDISKRSYARVIEPGEDVTG